MEPNTSAGSTGDEASISGAAIGSYPIVLQGSIGTPWISPAVVPYLIALVVFAGALEASFPPDHVVARVCHAIMTAGAVLGMASPGLRRRG